MLCLFLTILKVRSLKNSQVIAGISKVCLRAPERLQIKKMHLGRSNKRDASPAAHKAACAVFSKVVARSWKKEVAHAFSD
jgi:hypothetical protein